MTLSVRKCLFFVKKIVRHFIKKASHNCILFISVLSNPPHMTWYFFIQSEGLVCNQHICLLDVIRRNTTAWHHAERVYFHFGLITCTCGDFILKRISKMTKTVTKNEIKSNNPLGYEKISTLLKKFATPSVVAMIVSALYNVVDQIFIGRFVGDVGNAATNVAFPVTTICIAISVLCGVGGASCFSIELGRGHTKNAKDSIGAALVTAFALSTTYALFAGIFSKGMLRLFGGFGDALEYAHNYCSVLVFGIPFLVLGNVLSNFIRADGNPNFSMKCMVVGAITNIALDAVLVPLGEKYYGMGMQGAALATIISQIVSFTVAATYVNKFKTVDFKLSEIKFDFHWAAKVCSLGMSNCVNQIAILAVQVTMNNQLTTYALKDPNFGEALAHIPQAAFGVVMKVNSIFISFFVGMAQGSQPIVGFNYGAGQLQRSKKTFMLSASICFIAATVGFIFFQFFPQIVISIFGSGENGYEEFAQKTMRIFLSMLMLNGVQMTIANYFSAIGKPLKGVVLSLTRQILLIVPLMIILPLFFGLDGVLYAAPITDSIAFTLAAILIIFEFKRDKRYKEPELKVEITAE